MPFFIPMRLKDGSLFNLIKFHTLIPSYAEGNKSQSYFKHSLTKLLSFFFIFLLNLIMLPIKMLPIGLRNLQTFRWFPFWKEINTLQKQSSLVANSQRWILSTLSKSYSFPKNKLQSWLLLGNSSQLLSLKGLLTFLKCQVT